MTPCGGPAGVEADKIRTELGINYHMVRKESADPKLTVSCGPHCRNTIMKLTKNAAALLLAASLAVSVCATPVFATGVQTSDYITPSTTGEETSSGETQVTYLVKSSYEWTIPAKIDFGNNAGVVDANTGKTRTVNANLANNSTSAPTAAGDSDGTATKVCILNNIIDVDKTLTISISSTNAYYETGSKNSFFITTAGSATATGGQRLYYTVKTTDSGASELDITNNTKVVSAASGTVSAEKGLVFELDTKNGATAEKAGSYNGTLSFTASVS